MQFKLEVDDDDDDRYDFERKRIFLPVNKFSRV